MVKKNIIQFTVIAVFIIANISALSALQPPDPATMIDQAGKTGDKIAEAEAEIEPATRSYEELVVEFRKLQESNKKTYIIILSVLTAMALLLVLYFMHKCEGYTGRNIVNGAGLVLVIFATLFIVVAATTDEQMTASVGILGAIAGYLFGTATAGTGTSKEGKQ